LGQAFRIEKSSEYFARRSLRTAVKSFPRQLSIVIGLLFFGSILSINIPLLDPGDVNELNKNINIKISREEILNVLEN
jgi:hypothetical protein